MNKNILISLVVIGALSLAVFLYNDTETSEPASTLSRSAQAGHVIFKDNCTACHGVEARGTEQGPPLIHPFYHPGHHADYAIRRAVEKGVKAHHWQFGDMPPVEDLSETQVTQIIAFIRETQRANGIGQAQEHSMD